MLGKGSLKAAAGEPAREERIITMVDTHETVASTGLNNAHDDHLRSPVGRPLLARVKCCAAGLRLRAATRNRLLLLRPAMLARRVTRSRRRTPPRSERARARGVAEASRISESGP